jgi:hypothetical protein
MGTRLAMTAQGENSRMKKFINPSAHAVLDYVAAGSLIALGFGLRAQNRRAAIFAFANGAAVLGLSMLTNYPGGVCRILSYKTHGTIDILQAGVLAIGPSLLGFGDTTEGQLFYGQAALEGGVVAATDWEAQGAA